MLTLELLNTGVEFELETAVTQVVQKRLDTIRYGQVVPIDGVGVEFLGWPQVGAEDVLNIVDVSASIPENSSLSFSNEVTIYAGLNISLDHPNYLLTDQVNFDDAGEAVPLWKRHELQGEVSAVTIQRVDHTGAVSLVDPLYYTLVTSDNSKVYTTLANWFDESSGRFTMYFVQYQDGSGASQSELLDSQPAYREAVLDDIDPDTGLISTEAPAFNLIQSGPNWIFQMSHSATWYVQSSVDHTIYAIPSTLDTINDPWFVSIHNGNFTAVIEGNVYSYSIPEFYAQNWNPVSGFKQATYERAKKINPSLIKLQREDISADSTIFRHWSIQLVNKTTGDLEIALTSDSTLEGVTTSTNPNVSWDSTKFQDVDQAGGIIY